MPLELVRPQDVDLAQVDIEFAHIRRGAIEYAAGGRTTTIDKRAALAKPPFADSAKLWARAVELFFQARGRGEAKGEPFLIVADIYRKIGGGFR